MSQKKQRYIVGDLGFAWGVFDTQAPAEYEFEAGRETPHPSTNPLNTVRVAMYPTREEAVRHAEHLNAQAAGRREAG